MSTNILEAQGLGIVVQTCFSVKVRETVLIITVPMIFVANKIRSVARAIGAEIVINVTTPRKCNGQELSKSVIATIRSSRSFYIADR